MSVTGTKKVEQEGFAKKYGIGLFSIEGVNLSNSELKELGFYVKEGEEDEERNFLSEREGVDVVRIEMACREVTTKESPVLRKFSFFIENKERESQTTPGNFQWINNQGVCSYATDVDSLPEWFREGKDVRKALAGEEQFMSFMRACMAVNFKEGGTLGYNIKKFFKGNFKELIDDLKSDYLSTIIVALTVKERDVLNEDTGETEKKEYENFYNKAFAPGSMWKFMQNKREWTDEDVRKLLARVEANEQKKRENKGKPMAERKKLDYLNSLETLIATMASPEYPCKDRHYFGMLKEYVAGDDFVGSGNVLTQENNDY